MNCYDGCIYSKIEMNHVVCHFFDDNPMWVDKPYFECKYFEKRNENKKENEDVK